MDNSARAFKGPIRSIERAMLRKVDHNQTERSIGKETCIGLVFFDESERCHGSETVSPLMAKFRVFR